MIMKSPAPSVQHEIVSMAEDPIRIIGRLIGVTTYKRGISMIADKILNIGCERFTSKQYHELIAMTYYRWMSEVTDDEVKDYYSWVKEHLRPDLAKKITFLLNS